MFCVNVETGHLNLKKPSLHSNVEKGIGYEVKLHLQHLNKNVVKICLFFTQWILS